MKKIILLAALTGFMMTNSCQKYDDSALWNEMQQQAERIAALEAWQATVNGNIAALQELVAALQNNVSITAVAPVTSGAGGYVITFSNGTTATIANGAKGDKGDDGAAPQISIAEYPASSGVYYWTLNSAFIEVKGQKLPVTGAKGADGTNGANGATPQLRINTTTNYWEVSYNSGSTWNSLGVKATGATGAQGEPGANGNNGSDGDAIFSGIDTSNPAYVVFNLVGGGSITLPVYQLLGITFTLPSPFVESETKTIDYTVTDNVTIVKVMEVPTDWTVKVNTATQKITITAPMFVTDDNTIGVAVLFISDGGEQFAARPLQLAAFPSVPRLEVNRTTILALATAGTYYLGVASNTAWTATVNPEAASWCTLTNASATGNGTIKVDITAGIGAERAATLTISTAGTLTAQVAVTQIDPAQIVPPTYAATSQSWIVGEGDELQIWSDVIELPACNKTEFDGGSYPTFQADCRKNADDYRGYYYSWNYVNEHAAQLCPDAWRVPSKDDFIHLDILLGGTGECYSSCAALVNEYLTAWGGAHGGYVLEDGSLWGVGTHSFYTSTTLFNDWYMFDLSYSMDVRSAAVSRGYGTQVRCVKN
jgi:uncharacterized protein (TIGR02145 family)